MTSTLIERITLPIIVTTMSTTFYKAEISNIMDEMIRIIDRLNELTEVKETQLEWPPYCEAFQMPEDIKKNVL